MTKRLLLLNGFAALMVVLNHSASYGLNAMIFWADRYRPVTTPNYDQVGSLPYYVLFLIHQLAEFAIPAFLFVSGYFIAFAAKTDKAGFSWKSVVPRIKKLIVPYLIWSIVGIVMLQRFPPSFRQVMTIYYYIPLIIQFYLLSPVLVPLAKNHWKALLAVTAIIQLSIEGLRLLALLGINFPGLGFLLAITPVWFFPGRIFYFTIGVVTSLHLEKFGQVFTRIRWFLLAGVIFLLAFSIFEYEFLSNYLGKKWLVPEFSGLSKALFAITLVLCFLAFDQVKFPFSNKISFLGGKSLGIYFINTPALYAAGFLMYHLTPWMLGNPWLYQAILILFGLGVPLIMMSFSIKTPARSVYHYVFG